jgi:hypothetical protein
MSFEKMGRDLCPPSITEVGDENYEQQNLNVEVNTIWGFINML